VQPARHPVGADLRPPQPVESSPGRNRHPVDRRGWDGVAPRSWGRMLTNAPIVSKATPSTLLDTRCSPGRCDGGPCPWVKVKTCWPVRPPAPGSNGASTRRSPVEGALSSGSNARPLPVGSTAERHAGHRRPDPGQRGDHH
jgi:hypothetical protein